MLRRFFYFLLPLTFALCMNACSSTSAFNPFSSRSFYIQSARINQQAQLARLSQTLQENTASSSDKSSNTPLNSSISTAKILLNNNQPRLAINKLHEVSQLAALPKNQQMLYYQLASQAYLRMGHLSNSTLARISLNNYLTDFSAQQANQAIIWHNLLTLSNESLANLAKSTTAPMARGWFQLALITKQNANNPISLSNSLIAWQMAFPDHPAQSLLPNHDTLVSATHFTPPSSIALLLPLHGQFGEMGKAVQNGFMAAFYEKTSSTPSTNIKLYDTSQTQDIAALYQQAINEGAQFVVGPITKDEVYQLARRGTITVPTLALNVLPENQSVPANFFQLGLMPEQETEQMTEMLWQHGFKNLLVIAPQGDWGDKVRLTFTKLWQQLGGNIPASLIVNPQSDLKTDIAQTLNIVEKQDPTEKVHGKPKIEIERRQDIDGIVLLTSPGLARQIQPLLRYYYAGDLPLFSISSIYTGTPNPIKDMDLNGVIFSDMPWLLMSTPYDSLKKQFRSLWPAHYEQYIRLYALGIDSYLLATSLPRLIALPNVPIQGTTGWLYLGDNQLIDRLLPSAKFKNGYPSPWLS